MTNPHNPTIEPARERLPYIVAAIILSIGMVASALVLKCPPEPVPAAAPTTEPQIGST